MTVKHLLFGVCAFLGLETGLFGSQIQAQDLITTLEGTTIQADILEIRKQSIHYRPYGQPETEPQKVLKRDLQMVVYEDGLRQYFAQDMGAYEELKGLGGEAYDEWFTKGKQDAKIYYDDKGVMYLTLTTTALFPFYGLVTGMAAGGVALLLPPNPDLSQLPDQELFQTNLAYASGYVDGAQKQRIRRALQGFGFGVLVQGLIVILILTV